jgi:hypothetical protein
MQKIAGNVIFRQGFHNGFLDFFSIHLYNSIFTHGKDYISPAAGDFFPLTFYFAGGIILL